MENNYTVEGLTDKDLIPAYYITKISPTSFQIYDTSTKKVDYRNIQGTAAFIITLSGAQNWNTLTTTLQAKPDYSTFVITAKALIVNKKASTQAVEEPWKLVTVGGCDYFISNAPDMPEQLEKTASKTTPSKFQVVTKAQSGHSILAAVSALPEALGCDMEDMYFNPTQPDTLHLSVSGVCPEEVKSKVLNFFDSLCGSGKITVDVHVEEDMSVSKISAEVYTSPTSDTIKTEKELGIDPNAPVKPEQIKDPATQEVLDKKTIV